jgi:hypothetical protein
VAGGRLTARVFDPRNPPDPALPSPESRDGPESFDPDSTDYKAYGWVVHRTLPSLRVIRTGGSECCFHYADLDTAYPGGSEFVPTALGGKGNVITLCFAGRSVPFLVTLEGVRLRQVWELITGHCTPWIHELPTAVSFTRPDEPVIRSITFTPVLAKAANGGR